MMHAHGQVDEVRSGYSKNGVAWARVTLLCGSRGTRITCVAFESDAEEVIREVEEGAHVSLTLDPYWRKEDGVWGLQFKVVEVRIQERQNGKHQRAQPQRSQSHRASRKRREDDEEEAPF